MRAPITVAARRPALLIAAGGTATTVLLSGVVMALALSRQRLHERVLADLALAQREEQASQVLENALDAYIAIDMNDVIVEWNRQAASLFGWPAQEAIGRKLAETIVPSGLRERHSRAIATIAERAEHPLLGRRIEMPADCRDGSSVLVELSIVKVETPMGQRFAASLRDVTQQRKQQAEIQMLIETLEQRGLMHAALAGFLFQHGCHDRAVARHYLDGLFNRSAAPAAGAELCSEEH